MPGGGPNGNIRVRPEEPCGIRTECLLSHLQASSLSSLIALGITIVTISFGFPGGELMLTSICLGLVYVFAITYFYVGALNIEEGLAPLFHTVGGFPIHWEFLFRCSILTLLVVSVGWVGTQRQTAQSYSLPAISILLVAQTLYLLWDALVYWRGCATVRQRVRERFFLGDSLGLVASILILAMAWRIHLVRSITPPPGQSPPSLEPSALFLGGCGTLIFFVVTVLGLTWTKPISIGGGLLGFLCTLWTRVKEGRFR
jgi:hypothetical protein